MPQKRRDRPTPAVEPAAFPFRPPRWVRVWAIGLGVFAVVVLLVFGIPFATSGHWQYLVPLVVFVALAGLLAWRVGGLVTRPTPDGTVLVVRNRTRTHRLDRRQVRTAQTGTRPGRAATPVVVVVLQDGTEVPVDASMAAAFQTDLLDAQVAALRAWAAGRP